MIAAGRRVQKFIPQPRVGIPLPAQVSVQSTRMELGYARYAPPNKTFDRQIDALTAAGIAPGHVYVDKKSGPLKTGQG